MRGGGVGRLVVHPYGSVKAAVVTPTWVIRKDEGISGGALEIPRGRQGKCFGCFGAYVLLWPGATVDTWQWGVRSHKGSLRVVKYPSTDRGKTSGQAQAQSHAMSYVFQARQRRSLFLLPPVVIPSRWKISRLGSENATICYFQMWRFAISHPQGRGFRKQRKLVVADGTARLKVHCSKDFCLFSSQYVDGHSRLLACSEHNAQGVSFYFSRFQGEPRLPRVGYLN